MAKVTMKALLESGVHFGHRTHRWNPHMKPYIFTERNGIHIIDLQQTVKALDVSYNLVRDLVAEGGTVLFVGTKRQAHETIQMEAGRCNMPYVTVRWLGGMLTNWVTMRQRIMELERLERERDRGDFERLTKKEGLQLDRKIAKLEERFGGIRNMHKLPDMLFIVDVRREETAVNEANTLNIPVLALVDTNCDPLKIDHVIPSNDDAIRAIKLMVGFIADAVDEGRAMRKEEEIEEAPAAQVERDEELSDADLLGEATLAKVEAAQAEEAAKAEAKAEAEAKGDEKAEEEGEATEAEEKVETKAAEKEEKAKEEEPKIKEKEKEADEAKVESKPKTKTKAKAKTRSKTSAKKAEKASEAKAEPKTKSKAKAKTKTKAKAKAKAKTKAKTKSKTKPKTKSKTKTNTESKSEKK